MLRLPSTGLGKVSIMRWSLVSTLPLTLIFHPLPSFVLFLVIYSYRRVQLMCRWVGNMILKTITLSLLGRLTSLSSSSSSSSDSGPSSSAGWNTATAQGLKKSQNTFQKTTAAASPTVSLWSIIPNAYIVKIMKYKRSKHYYCQ